MNKILKQIEITPLDNLNCTNCLKKYDEIDILLGQHEITAYDINKLVKNKSVDKTLSPQIAPKITFLRDLVFLKNSYTLKKASSSKYWAVAINELKDKLQTETKKTLTYQQVEDSLLGLLKEYMHDWLGFWSTIETSKTGSIKNIKIFDLEDYNKIKKGIQKKSQKKSKQ
jgi:hypothetical protein